MQTGHTTHLVMSVNGSPLGLWVPHSVLEAQAFDVPYSDTLLSVVSVMVQPPFPFSTHCQPPPTPSACTLLQLQSILAQVVQLHCTVRLTLDQYSDQYQTHLDLVPMPRATVYIPFLHSSYLPDPLSLTITGNYSFLV